ncbi:MAG: bifunctional diguanylate cyclase/phosphodiesterase [Cocleimonas sp.]
MKLTEIPHRISNAGLSLVWQAYTTVLFVLITSLLFISDPVIKYSTDISIAVLTIIAVTSGFFICKKSLLPWGTLLLAIILISSSFIINSLIFFGFQISTQLPFWLEVAGVFITASYSASLLYMFEKQYNLKGVSIDFTLIALSTTCLVFLVSPNLLNNVVYQLDTYEQSLVFNIILGSVFLSLLVMANFLSKKVIVKDLLLGVMVLSLSIHFYLEAFIAFKYFSNNETLNKISWFFYQLPGILAIFYMFTEEFEYNFKPNKAKKMGLKLLWIASILGVLIVPIGVIYRWIFELPSLDHLTIAVIGGVMSIIVICRMIILIINYEKQRQTLKEIAFTDSLTGISNYLGLQSNISQLENIFILNINIEDFKSINDMYDRKFGDQVLISLAKRIKNTSGVLHAARMTGDNFLAILQIREKSIDEAFLAFEKEIGLWDTVLNKRVAVPLTYGASHSRKSENLDILVRKSEMALKSSRAQKTNFTLYQESDDLFVSTLKTELPRHELREILQRSIDKNSLPIHFQPIYDIQTGSLKALEMLIRVSSIKHGLLMPRQFLEQAKSYGLLTDLTHTCISMVAKQFHSLPDVTININIPPYMLDDRKTLNQFITSFKTNELPTNRFCIEVTEDGDIPTENLIPAINLLKNAGFTIAMDDFGTGYSSLGRLSSLPFDSVKIDRSLLVEADNGNKTILESAINLVKRLGVSVCVEGVETLEQLVLVRSLGADSVQGFLFSKPKAVITDNQFSLNAADIVAEF